MIIDEKTRSLEDHVYERLEEDILTGLYKRGEPLTEMTISKRFNISRTPVRSAIHRLAEEGLVKLSPNKGAVVTGISQDDIIDIYKIRMRLDGLAAAMAAEKMSDEDIERLRESVELSEFYSKRKDAEHQKELDTAFHALIYTATGSRMLAGILSELHKKAKLYRKISLGVESRAEKSINEHREILEAIEHRDPAAAERLTQNHVKKALSGILSGINHELSPGGARTKK